jgi:hypothetical protein
LVVLVVLSIAVFDGGLRGPAVTVMVLDDRGSERFFAFAMLACDRLCYNRLPCATTARLP